MGASTGGVKKEYSPYSSGRGAGSPETTCIGAGLRLIFPAVSFCDRLVRPGVGDPANQGSLKMQYLLMIYRSEAELGKMDAAARKEMTAEYGAFTQSIIQSGHFKAGDGLQPSTTATTVRVRDGKTLTTDGPFAETREQLGGYYLVEAKDLDTALAIAARIPGAKTGSIEVRPVMIYD